MSDKIVSASPSSSLSSSTSLIGSRIAHLVVDSFRKLPRNGKPAPTEWTVLAGMVAVPSDSKKSLILLSLATGTQCLGGIERRPELLSDSHAEILSRRVLNQYLLNDVRDLYNSEQNESSFFVLEPNGLCNWRRESMSLYLYISQLPCGDAAICEKKDQHFGGISDINRTGAKPVQNGVQDPRLGGKLYHSIGVLRTKPGRGEPTDSMCCSDKIARWIACGVQNTFLSILLEGPIPLSGIVVGGPVYDEASLQRALVGRHRMPLENVKFFHADDCYAHRRRDSSQRCAMSVLYVHGAKGAEVAVDGRKHGIVKKCLGTPRAESSVCRRQILLSFRRAIGDIMRSGRCANNFEALSFLSYMQLKSRRPEWVHERRKQFELKMPHWTTKDCQDFSE